MMTTQDFSRQLKILMLAGEQLTLRTGGFAGLRATLKGLCTRFQASYSAWIFMAFHHGCMFTSWKSFQNLFAAFDRSEILKHVAITYTGQRNYPRVVTRSQTNQGTFSATWPQRRDI